MFIALIGLSVSLFNLFTRSNHYRRGYRVGYDEAFADITQILKEIDHSSAIESFVDHSRIQDAKPDTFLKESLETDKVINNAIGGHKSFLIP